MDGDSRDPDNTPSPSSPGSLNTPHADHSVFVIQAYIATGTRSLSARVPETRLRTRERVPISTRKYVRRTTPMLVHEGMFLTGNMSAAGYLSRSHSVPSTASRHASHDAYIASVCAHAVSFRGDTASMSSPPALVSQQNCLTVRAIRLVQGRLDHAVSRCASPPRAHV